MSEKLSKADYFENYEKLRMKMKNEMNAAYKGEGSSISLNYLNELNKLYCLVQKQKIKDTKVHLEDSEVFKEASDFAALNARNIKFGNNLISLDDLDFLKHLKKFAKTNGSAIINDDLDDDDEEEEEEDIIEGEHIFNQTNWLSLGMLYYQVSKKPISVDFLNGPIESERKKINQRSRNIDDTKGGSSTTARQVEASDIQDNEEKNTAYMVRKIYEHYIQNDDGSGIIFYRFFINPFSFSQSIENLFFTSFLIKDGRLKLYDNDGIPTIKRVSNEELHQSQLDSSNVVSNHHIASFNYKVWKDSIEMYNISDCFLGHRTEQEDQMPNDV
ncbi:unnamed protein product [Candida verbasci]|uniref:Non-structural maintenance of chromosomes element 4 n=1 Tax=Candida verbasci TaxID=1227364 RepID=A0A9W4XBK0_9ASCO|nr:unnamed protein product [Candida verbasci]